MDIHKPKPWHGAREFLKEYLIIVVGVLTALAAEQAVEWLHWRHQAQQAEQELAAGLQVDVLNSVRWIAIQPCFKAWLLPLATSLQQPGQTWRAAPLQLPPSSNITPRITRRAFTSPGGIWSHAAWESVETSGALSHLEERRVGRYADAYRMVELARQWQVQIQDINDDLAPLAYDRQLTDAEKASYLQRLSNLETKTANMRSFARSTLMYSHMLGLDPPKDQVDERVQDLRQNAGSCVAAVKLPLE
jgi:hypothetical protein